MNTEQIYWYEEENNEDRLEEIYTDGEEFVEDDSIADWEEGFMNGYAEA